MSFDATTRDTRASTIAESSARALTFTILWHPEPERIGRVASGLCSEQPRLSRSEPVFDDGAPLTDSRASRSALRFVVGRDGSAGVWPGRSGLQFSVAGVPAKMGARIGSQDLSRGVRIELGSKGPVVLVQRAFVAPADQRHGLVGSSALLAGVREQIDQLGKTPYPVLVRGPTGTGKELVAQGLHRASKRRDQPFVAINMAALAAGTATSQLFGHARGSFTGATRPDSGFWGQAEGGTLFLDEIGAATSEVQAQLLRALECGEIQPVGGKVRMTDVRIIAATDEDLEVAVQEGRVRSALVHRLAHGVIQLSPLNERPADLASQAVYFLQQAMRDQGFSRGLVGGERPWLTRKLMLALLEGRWSGNTRQLRATCEQLVVRHGSQSECGVPELEARPVRQLAPSTPQPAPPVEAAPDTLEETPDIERSLADNGYLIVPKAMALGISRNKLRREMDRLNLPRPRELTADQIRAALEQHEGPVSAARALRVSERGLKLRMTALGLS